MDRCIYKWNEQETIDAINKEMLSPEPTWIGRVGGTDTDFVKERRSTGNNRSTRRLTQFNGYYDKRGSGEDYIKNLDRFCDMYTHSCSVMDFAMVGNKAYIDALIEGSDPQFLDFFQTQKITSYSFVEGFEPFMKSFQSWGAGKTILIISPFSQSINFQTQSERIHNLFANTQHPSCKFITYNTPVTYNGGGYPSEIFDQQTQGSLDWFDMCEKIYKEISSIDFDIALLSCGSYAMYLGAKIKTNLNKSAFYLGGMLNVFFNIYGRRYDVPWFNAFLNLDYQIQAIENDTFFSQEGQHTYPSSESVRAYFGKRRY